MVCFLINLEIVWLISLWWCLHWELMRFFFFFIFASDCWGNRCWPYAILLYTCSTKSVLFSDLWKHFIFWHHEYLALGNNSRKIMKRLKKVASFFYDVQESSSCLSFFLTSIWIFSKKCVLVFYGTLYFYLMLIERWRIDNGSVVFNMLCMCVDKPWEKSPDNFCYLSLDLCLW